MATTKNLEQLGVRGSNDVIGTVFGELADFELIARKRPPSDH